MNLLFLRSRENVRLWMRRALVAGAFATALSGYAFEEPESAPVTALTPASDIEEIRSELESLDMPLFEFTLKDGEFPTFDVAEAPEGMSGKGIMNANYVEGSLVISRLGEVLYESGEYVEKKSGVRLKVRGNTSSSQDWIPRKSYKIKLSKKADLLFRDDVDARDKNWVLLGYASMKFNYLAGAAVGNHLGMIWEPEGIHVNVIVNGQYMGLYYLAESVEQGEHRVNISDSGYIVENDPYFWIPDEVYFKSNHQAPNMGWTFKYPDTDDFDETSIGDIQWTVNAAEKVLYGNGDLEQYIDFDSFAAWLLAHDIMRSSDGTGGNMYVVKDDFNALSPFSSRLGMGPLWDFDGSFDGASEEFSAIHSSKVFIFPQLLEIPEFQDIYLNKYVDVRETVKDAVMGVVEKYLDSTPDLWKARVINTAMGKDELYFHPGQNPYEHYRDLDEFFTQRLIDLDKLILGKVGVGEIPSDSEVGESADGMVRHYNASGLPVYGSAAGLVISVDASGNAVKEMK